MQQHVYQSLTVDWTDLSWPQKRELSHAIWAVEQHVSVATFEEVFLGREAAARYENSDLIHGRRLTAAELEASPLWLALCALCQRLDGEHTFGSVHSTLQ